jgi:DMSO/TMAO reductase YedYZ molybdopterin-dependent catalytic subunit
MTRRSFAVGAGAFLAGLAGWQWLRTRPQEDGAPWPLRRMLRFNEAVGRAAFGGGRLAPTFPLDRAARARDMRVNGGIGLETPVGAQWSLVVEDDAGRQRSFSLADLRNLPQTQTVTELKCVEGWSQVILWSGPSLLDFAVRHRLGTRSGREPNLRHGRDDLYQYAALETPDGAYYVGMDVESALHPQTLLCLDMGGEPLTAAHGAPVRLAVPVKYGFKSIKRVGRIRFTDRRPPDYWAERGYDWYAGL